MSKKIINKITDKLSQLSIEKEEGGGKEDLEAEEEKGKEEKGEEGEDEDEDEEEKGEEGEDEDEDEEEEGEEGKEEGDEDEDEDEDKEEGEGGEVVEAHDDIEFVLPRGYVYTMLFCVINSMPYRVIMGPKKGLYSLRENNVLCRITSVQRERMH
jgi:hypothetical protein